MAYDHLATVLLYTILGIALIEVPLLAVARRREKARSRYVDMDGNEWVIFSNRGDARENGGGEADAGLPADGHGGHCGDGGGSGDGGSH